MKTKLTKSEKEVMRAIKGLEPLPYKGKSLINYQRHNRAIERLKEKGFIEKGVDHILKVTYNGEQIIRLFNKI